MDLHLKDTARMEFVCKMVGCPCDMLVSIIFDKVLAWVEKNGKLQGWNIKKKLLKCSQWLGKVASGTKVYLYCLEFLDTVAIFEPRNTYLTHFPCTQMLDG